MTRFVAKNYRRVFSSEGASTPGVCAEDGAKKVNREFVARELGPINNQSSKYTMGLEDKGREKPHREAGFLGTSFLGTAPSSASNSGAPYTNAPNAASPHASAPNTAVRLVRDSQNAPLRLERIAAPLPSLPTASPAPVPEERSLPQRQLPEKQEAGRQLAERQLTERQPLGRERNPTARGNFSARGDGAKQARSFSLRSILSWRPSAKVSSRKELSQRGSLGRNAAHISQNGRISRAWAFSLTVFVVGCLIGADNALVHPRAVGIATAEPVSESFVARMAHYIVPSQKNAHQKAPGASGDTTPLKVGDLFRQTHSEDGSEVNVREVRASLGVDAKMGSTPEASPALNVANKKGAESAPREITRESISVQFDGSGFPKIVGEPLVRLYEDGQKVRTTDDGKTVTLSIQENLQNYTEELLRKNRVQWGSIVAMEPATGRVLAFSSYSAAAGERQGELFSQQANFPAASLFKMVTAAAAIESSGLEGEQAVYFRGGDHSLGPHNALPDMRKDRRFTTFTQALGHSNNPAFARIALNNFSVDVLTDYAQGFGFNQVLPLDGMIDRSSFTVSPESPYEFARTAAGFGEARTSTLHAALLMSTIANKGIMMRPFSIEKISGSRDEEQYTARPVELGRPVLESTSQSLMEMLKSTVTDGTARRYYHQIANNSSAMPMVSGKTGTLSGKDPDGLYLWFVGAAPSDAPEIAVAALVVDAGGARIRGSELALKVINFYFSQRDNPKK